MEQSFQHIEFKIEDKVAYITLNRPEVHNALNIIMIREISSALDIINGNHDAIITIIDSKGDNFSAGADLKWMKSGIEQSPQQVKGESKELAILFNKIFNSTNTTLCIVKGKVIGGANGIVAASDIVISAADTSFAFTEVKLGLIPATIAPYVYRKARERAMEWMLTARKFDAHEAYLGGLVNFIVTDKMKESKVDSVKNMILSNGPNAIQGVKSLFLSGLLQAHPDETIDKTSDLIAKFRTSPEGFEGITSFFEKRKPAWLDENK